MVLLFSHKMSEEQREDAVKNLRVEKFVEIDDEIAKIWANIPPELMDISDYLKPVKEFISNNTDARDYVLIQGEPGAVVKMVHYARAKGLIPLYATTKREVKESIEDGKIKKVSLFKHVRFRRY